MPLRRTVRNVSESAIDTPIVPACADAAISAAIAVPSRNFFIFFLLHMRCPAAPHLNRNPVLRGQLFADISQYPIWNIKSVIPYFGMFIPFSSAVNPVRSVFYGTNRISPSLIELSDQTVDMVHAFFDHLR